MAAADDHPDSPVTAAVVVLAAGGGSRYGGVKQLHDAGGRPMLERVLAAVEQADVGERVVVLGAFADRVLAAVDLHGARAVVSDRWSEGQAASLHDGLATLSADAAVVVLGDGPGLDPRAIARLVGAWNGRTPLAADYGSGRSHPVLLPRSTWPELPQSGETPGRSVAVRLIDCRDLHPPGDVDYAD
jgi:CTP:molybdopterin cytidylyltransferase MocA